MADAVADMLFRFGADISDLRTKLQEVDGKIERFARNTNKQLNGLRGQFKALKEPISNVAQLANSLGNAFGGAASKATGLVNGLVGAFSGGNLIGVGIGATVGLLSVFIAKLSEAKEAAEKASRAEVDARIDQNRKIQETIDKLDEEIKRRNILLRGESPSFAAAQEAATSTEGVAAQRQAELDQVNAELELARSDIDAALAERRAALERADRETRAGVEAIYDSRLRRLRKQVADLETTKKDVEGSLRLANEAADKARENLAGASVTELSTPITPETLTPPGRESGAAKAESAAEARRKAAAEKAARERAEIRLAIAQGEDEQAIALYQNRLETIDALETVSDAEKAEAKVVAFQQLQERLGQIEADRIQRGAGAAKDAARAEKEAFDEVALEAKKDTAELVSIGQSFGQAVSDFLVTPLTEGFASLADFAKRASGLVLSLVADLLKAAILATILSALFGGTPGALAGVGGLVGTIGKGLNLKGYATGGPVGRDTVPAMLEPGEFVQPVEAVRAFGVDFMESIRQAGRLSFASGGLVKAGAGGGAGGFGSRTVVNVMAFDAPAISRSAGRLDGVQTRRINSRQGALFQETLRRNLRG